MIQTVIAYYEAILRREPTDSELENWVGFLESESDLEEALADFAAVLCLQNEDVLSIMRFYQAVFDRVPDTGGLTFWVNVFRSVQENNPNLTYEEALLVTLGDWLTSEEYVERFGEDLSNEDFLGLLYLNILGRPADQGGFDYWLARLNGEFDPITREQLIVEFAESDEFKNRVDEEAQAILKSDAAIQSDLTEDDLEYEFPNDTPYDGELTNEAPVDILAGTDISEDAENGDLVNDGQLTAVDVDGLEEFTWELLDDAGGAFALDDPNAQRPNLIVADADLIDFETASEMMVLVQLTDREGNTYQEWITIDVNDVNEGPFNLDLDNLVITEQDGSDLPGGSNPGAPGALVGLLSAEDEDFGDSQTFTILDQSIPGAFAIVNGNELRVANHVALDSELGVTSVQVEVQVEDDGGLTAVKTFDIDITPIVDEDPTNVLPEDLVVSASLPAGFPLSDLLAEDPDTSLDFHTFEILPGGDPTDGGFEIDITGTKLLVGDPTKLASDVLEDVDDDGLVVVTLAVRIFDSAGNFFDDTIEVTVDQNGDIIPFTDDIVEVLDGTEGDDLFTANAGLGANPPFPLIPGTGSTANAGDIANGEGGHDIFRLVKAENNLPDGWTIISGVALNDIEEAILVNEDQSPLPPIPLPAPIAPIIAQVCTPCINVPAIAPVLDAGVVFDASLAPDLDTLSVAQSRASAAYFDVQADFWIDDPLDVNDDGPVLNIYDTTADIVWLDSDPQAKVFEDVVNTLGLPFPDGKDDGELVVTVDEVRINELRVTENASGNEPGGPRAEQVGTLSIKASGLVSNIGSINMGFPGSPTPAGGVLPNYPGVLYGAAFLPAFTHTLNIEAADLTDSSPWELAPFFTNPDPGGVVAAANTAAIDFFAGHVSGIGNGIAGLENVNLTGVDGDLATAGDFFIQFGFSVDTDGDGFSMEILEGDGNSFLYFEPGGFNNGVTGVSIDAGNNGDFDTVGVFGIDLGNPFQTPDIVTGVERLKVLDVVGAPGGDGQLWLTAFDDTLQELVLAAGVNGDVSIYDIPSAGGETDQENLVCALPPAFEEFGFIINIDQCCWPLQAGTGQLPPDFDLFLQSDNVGDRVDVIFNVDPGFLFGVPVFVDNLNTDNVGTLHLRVQDCDEPSKGVFEVRHLNATQAELETLLLSSNETVQGASTTRILHEDADYDPNTGAHGEDNTPFGNTINLTLINGLDDLRNQEFLELAGGGQNDLKFLPILEDWGLGPNNNRPQDDGFFTDADDIEDQLNVSPDGVVANLGEGDDMITGYRGGLPGDGADFINGNGGDDLIFGARGNDNISGGTGDDEIQGEEGDDCIWGNEGDDLMLGGSGNDFIDGGFGDDIGFGGIGNDTLHGGFGDDALCGDDGDDCLFGGEGNDLLIGGRGDDFLDAGESGTDVLVGDYNCEPCYTLISVNDIDEGDTWTVGIDFDGDGTIDPDEEATYIVQNGDGATEIINGLVSALNALGGLNGFEDCFDISNVGDVLQICSVTDERPAIELNGTDAPVASVHKFQFSGQIHPTDEIQLNITGPGPGDVLGANFDLDDIPFITLPTTGLFWDDPAELLQLAQEVAAYLNTQVPAPYSVDVNVDGEICIIGPGDDAGTDPVVAFTIADGGEVDQPATPEIWFVDLSDLDGWEAGDEIRVDFTTADDGADFGAYVVQLGDTLADIIEGLRVDINAAAGVNAIIDPNDANRICIISDTPGTTGEFTVNPFISLTEDLVGNADEFIELTFNDLTAGESFSVDISDTVGPVLGPVVYGQAFTNSLLETLEAFIALHGATILADHGLAVSIGGTAGSETLVFTGEFTPDGIAIATDFNGTGSISPSVLDFVDTTLAGGSTGLKQSPTDDIQNFGENIDDLGITTPAEPRTDADLTGLLVEVPKTEAGQDVFVASSRVNNEALFGPNGYDNDLLPQEDFAGLLDAAGLVAGTNGTDGGVEGVVYVLDFNQGGGGDDLSTWDVNEAFDKAENTTDAGDVPPDGGRWYSQLDAAFNGDPDRLEGDKIAFRKLDGDLDECGLTTNYAEEENTAASRDDADADAFNAFNANDDLRYYVNARTFEDALDELGFTWGVDITQADVDAALVYLEADLADGGGADGSAGGNPVGVWGNALDLLGGAGAVNVENQVQGILDQAKADSWLRVYYNDADSVDAAPEAVMELVGLDQKEQISFEDIVGADCVDPDCIEKEEFDICVDPYIVF